MLALLGSCSPSRYAKKDAAHVKYAKEHAALVEEMVKYVLIFGKEHQTREFNVEVVADRSVRRKLYSLGARVDITYFSPGVYDSTVTFKTINFSGVYEYMFDFATRPRRYGDKGQPGNSSVMIQVTDRIYYSRRPFPMM